MSLNNPSVFSFLSASPCAKVAGALDLGLGRSAAIWRNAHDRMRYERPDGHTFSLYLEGGCGTRRLDSGGVSGWPGALCIMPQGASSEWDITDAFEFVHLYVPDDELKRTFTETFDRDCRLMIMPEATFDHAPALAAALRTVAYATRSGDRLLADEGIAIALAQLFIDPRYGGIRPVTIKSGLAPAVRRRIVDYIEAHLDAQITLPDLAAMAGLSEFHLQRMFRASCGVSPQGWVQHRRLAHAKSATGRNRADRPDRFGLRLQQPEPPDTGVQGDDRHHAFGLSTERLRSRLSFAASFWLSSPRAWDNGHQRSSVRECVLASWTAKGVFECYFIGIATTPCPPQRSASAI